MPVFDITSPDGRKFRVTAPEGASREDALARVKAQYSAAPEQVSPAQPEAPQATMRPVGLGRSLSALQEGAAETLTLGLSRPVAAVARETARALKGEGFDFGRGMKDVKAEREAMIEENPLESLAGAFMGGAISGTALFKGLLNLGKAGVPVLSPAARAVTGFKPGQYVRNTGRAAVLGATGGALQETFEGGDTATGALAGGLTGGTLQAAAPIARAGWHSAAGFVSKQAQSSNALRALAKRLDESPETLKRSMDYFRNITGRPPRLAEIVGEGSGAELALVSQSRKEAGDVFRDAALETAAQRPGRMAAAIRKRGTTTDIATEITQRDTAMDRAMAPIRRKTVVLRDRDRDLLNAPALRRAVADDDELRAALGDLADGTRRTIRIGEIEDVRIALSTLQGRRLKSNPGLARRIGQLRDSLTRIGRDAVPEYGLAVDEYAAHSRAIKGFETGKAGTAVRNVGDRYDLADLRTREGKQGHSVGTRTRLAERAEESEVGAVRLADELRQDAGLTRDLRATLSPAEARALQEQGRLETQSAERLGLVASRPRAKSEDIVTDVQRGIESAVALGGHTLTGFKAHVLGRILTSSQLRPGTARKLAELATDPNELPGVIAALKRARLRDDEIVKLFRDAAIASGIGAAGVVE